ncbi:MAG: small ribosomal subunit biogenesis GTPase RsgA [Gammaproteobacteria bacterium]|nr:small ribosomal subunit biogenesis GTPase RsgA [Gammaproteobacteria bacterium]MCW8911030.1 small ribosomal subunit biogenesis GTPase RsgA [Gammaproteobacteria bacterium]MCW9004540.1 small ribosomal subunit biogenesis GTPase RsgA [Gammaproteobacteria bacterium]MCW9055975.1 small ribosomal subunit biogenesis GTPase RsgA [Gammaproteobacteria bacterium]
MAKRRISEQQKRRIESIQQKRRDKAGKNQHEKEQQLEKQGLGPEQPGQVITNFGQSLIIENNQQQLFRCVARQNLGPIVCGDNVIWQQSQNNDGVIVALQERKNLLQKPGFGGKLKPMSANIDQIIIVASVQPEPNPYLIDRYLVAAETLPALPIILINKIDLLNDSNRQIINDIEKEYSAIGYQVIKTSNVIDQGFKQLLDALQAKTSIFVGLSGVGKSSIINHLLPELDIRVGELSAASGEGTHTTTSSTLYNLPCGGKLIDSPGVRDFGLWNTSAENILKGFRELRPFTGQCKFSNCNHENEPDCAIKNAFHSNKISAHRFKNYQKMLKEYS